MTTAGSIQGPVVWPAASDPPTFTIDSSDQPYWMVELATTPELMSADAADNRTDTTYYLGADEAGTFGSGTTWTIAQHTWERFATAHRLFYRLWTSRSDTDFVDWTVSGDDLGTVPFITVGSSSTPTGPSSESDLADLCTYLNIASERWAEGEDRYFARLSELLAFHQVISQAELVTAGTFRAAVRDFQRSRQISDDGIPGETTLWALNHDWALANQLDLVKVSMDEGAPAGVQHDDDRHGYLAIRIRSDVAESLSGLKQDLNGLGVRLTSSGSLRPLDAAVTTGRSTTSIHYSAAALDLATTMGMTLQGPVPPDDQPYVITQDGERWHVWAWTDDGQEQVLEAVCWEHGATSTRTVEGRFVDLTAAAEARGWQGIGHRSTFPSSYLSAEWWHLQNTVVLIPWISQFGAEVLRLHANTETRFQAQQGLWDQRARIFQRGKNGWW